MLQQIKLLQYWLSMLMLSEMEIKFIFERGKPSINMRK